MPRIGALKKFQKQMKHPHPFECFLDIAETNPNRPIVLLFRTVILQAIYEAKAGCPEAAAWLTTPSEGLQQVADYAETYPHSIKTLATQALEGRFEMVNYKSLRYVWSQCD